MEQSTMPGLHGQLGIIGYGSMGKMILNGFLGAKVLQPQQVAVSSRSYKSLEGLSQQWPGIDLHDDNISLVQQCRYIVIAVKPKQVIPLMEEIASFFRPDAHIISIAACIQIDVLQEFFAGSITRVIPTLTSEVGEGITLICHNEKVPETAANLLANLFSCFSRVRTIHESSLEAATNMTSCAPGLIASIFQEFLAVGIRHSNIAAEDAEAMLRHTLYGTAKLLYEQRISFSQIISRVATKGGITEEGVHIFRRELPEIFEEVFTRILNKYEAIREDIHREHL